MMVARLISQVVIDWLFQGKPSSGPQVSFAREELLNPDPLVSHFFFVKSTRQCIILKNLNNFLIQI